MKATKIGDSLYHYRGYTIGLAFGKDWKNGLDRWFWIEGTGLEQAEKVINGDVSVRDFENTLRAAKETVDGEVDYS